MISKILLVVALSLNVYGQSLSEITDALHKSKKVQSIQNKARAELAQHQQFNTYEAPELELGVIHVQSREESHNWTEYAVGVSQNITNPFASESKKNVTTMLSKATKKSVGYEIYALELELASKYYNACMADALKAKALELLAHQKIKLKQLQKAFEFGEVSKKDYLFYKLDFLKLQQNVNSYTKSAAVELSELQEDIDNLNIEKLQCNDLIEPKKALEFGDVAKHRKVQDLSYKLSAAKSQYELSKDSIDVLGYSVGYEREHDINRYIFGVSIPLNFATSHKEKARGEYYHTQAALSEEMEAVRSEIVASTKSSSLRLSTLFDEYSLLKNEIVPLSKELLKLSEFAYKSGEGSVLENISASRSYQESLLEMLSLKKEYYKEYFELQKIADIKNGENNE